MRKYILFTVVLVLIALIGCREKGAVEKAGERVDEVIDNVQNGDATLREKGVMEKAGKSIDDSVKKTN